MSRKIDTLLDTLERQSNLSKDGRAWLIAAADPFHDQDIAIAGMPDVSSASTVVQLIKKQVQVSVPPTTGTGAVANGSNWDCSIALFPNFVAQLQGTLILVNNLGQDTNDSVLASPCYAGGLVYNAGPQGADLWPNDVNSANPNTLSQRLDIREYCKGNSRIIGMAFEVVNTTAEINLQGQVTAYRMPTQSKLTSIQSGATDLPVVTYITNRWPPANIASAQLLYGSRSWAAKEGGYVVSRMNSQENPIVQPTNNAQAWLAGDFSATQTGTTNVCSIGSPGNAGLLGLPDIISPFDISGLHFTGLSYATTLTVNVRWLVERMPSAYESDLVVLATPSSSYDPLALELYSRCLNAMPPGVMLKENPLGEWFRSALAKVADFAPKIGKFVGNFVPGAAAIGEGVGNVAGYARNLIPEKKKKTTTTTTTEIAPVKLQGSASTTRMLTQK